MIVVRIVIGFYGFIEVIYFDIGLVVLKNLWYVMKNDCYSW